MKTGIYTQNYDENWKREHKSHKESMNKYYVICTNIHKLQKPVDFTPVLEYSSYSRQSQT